MADTEEFQRVTDPADPNRCQGVTSNGQCLSLASPGAKFCSFHGPGAVKQVKTQALRNFRLTQYQSRVGEFADNDQLKSLREEIGIVRMVLETVLNQCQTPVDLLMNTTKISNLIGQIEKLVVSCHRLEEKTGLLMDATGALVLANSLIDIISEHVTDEAALEAVSSKILAAIAKKPENAQTS